MLRKFIQSHRPGRILRKDITPQTFYDEMMEPRNFKPGEWIAEDMIKRCRIPDRLFLHTDSLRLRGAFEFAHKKKGKFSVGIIRTMFGRGDVLMASIIAKALKWKYGKDVSVWFAVHPGYEDLLKGNPWIDRIFDSKEKLMDAGPDINCNVNDLEFRVELQDFERYGKVVKNRTTIYLEQLDDLFVENHTPWYGVTEKEREWAKKELKKKKVIE